jgi:hypothetical protein
MFKYKDPDAPAPPGKAKFVTSDKRVVYQERRARERGLGDGTARIEITGTLVLECLAQAQIFKIRCLLLEASNEIDKLETLLKESKNEKNLSDYDDFIRACRILR